MHIDICVQIYYTYVISNNQIVNKTEEKCMVKFYENEYTTWFVEGNRAMGISNEEPEEIQEYKEWFNEGHTLNEIARWCIEILTKEQLEFIIERAIS